MGPFGFDDYPNEQLAKETRAFYKDLVTSPYWLAFWIVKTCRNLAIPIFLAVLFLVLKQWTLDFNAYDYQGPFNLILFIFFAIKWRAFSFLALSLSGEDLRNAWLDWRLILWFGFLFWFLWVHAFVAYFFVACFLYELRRLEICLLRRSIDKKNSRDVLGLDPIKVEEMRTIDYAEENHLQVIGSEKHLKSLCQRFLEADAQRDRSIIFLAPEGENGIFEEVTKVLRDRPAEELRTFFYYSLKDQDLSSSYSPFYKGNANFLRSWLMLDKESKEAEILMILLTALNELQKPFGIRDLELLLTTKRAAAVIKDQNFKLNYSWQFDALWKPRAALLAKLQKCAKAMKLEQYPITAGFPLDIADILKSGKHLYIELAEPFQSLLYYFLYHLWLQFDKEKRPYLYLIYPEKLEDKWLFETYFKNMDKEVYFRIFSTGFHFPYANRDWSTIWFREHYLKREPRDERFDYLWDQMLTEKSRSKDKAAEEGKHFETWEIMKSLCSPMKHEIAYYAIPRGAVIPFYVPAHGLGRMEYEPLQQRFKPEDLLWLQRMVPKVKIPKQTYDLGALDIIAELGPRGPLGGKKDPDKPG